MADQFRADCLGVDGNRIIRTPNLDRIAREGVHFRHAYSSTPTCTPARAGLLTGCSPWRHGMLGYGRQAERYGVEMPRALREAGYYTMGIGHMHYHPLRNHRGFHQMLLEARAIGRAVPGFRDDYCSWFWSHAPNLDPDATGLGPNDYPARPYALPENLHPTYWTAEVATEFLRTYNRPEPFFLKLSFIRPHSPYDPPKRWFDAYASADLPPARAGKWAERYRDPSGPDLAIWHGDLGSAQVRNSRQGYYGAVSFVDEQIGHVLEALEQRGWLDETLILFTSDHGDMMGDHHLWRKAYAYEGSARIPLLMRWPSGLVSAPRGQTATQPVELRDVLPTFLEAAGASRDSLMDGGSLLGLVRGRSSEWRSYIDLEHDICYSPEIHWNALTDGRRKYIFHARDGEEQLFDLVQDPGELRDLASDPAYGAELRSWRGRMIEHLAERGRPFVDRGRLLTRPASYLYSPNFPRS
jgi:arylsulfatase A-like enzyme